MSKMFFALLNLEMQKRIGVTVDTKIHDESKGSFRATTKRRALGDITNAVKLDDPKDKVSKKPQQIVLSVQQQPLDENLQSNVMVEEEEERVYMQRPSDDIDARDAENPLLVTEYVDEMYDNFRSCERKYMINSTYMTNQPHINDKMRAILIDWLVEVHMKFKMVPETLYTSVNFIDRYLECKQVRRSKLQLVGVASLLVRLTSNISLLFIVSRLFTILYYYIYYSWQQNMKKSIHQNFENLFISQIVPITKKKFLKWKSKLLLHCIIIALFQQHIHFYVVI